MNCTMTFSRFTVSFPFVSGLTIYSPCPQKYQLSHLAEKWWTWLLITLHTPFLAPYTQKISANWMAFREQPEKWSKGTGIDLWGKMKRWNLYSLAKQQLRSRMITVYKYLKNVNTKRRGNFLDWSRKKQSKKKELKKQGRDASEGLYAHQLQILINTNMKSKEEDLHYMLCGYNQAWLTLRK